MKISYGQSRYATSWTNDTITWSELTARLANTTRTTETAAQYAAMKKDAQGSIKDLGGFIGGHLAGERRKKGHVLARSIITLDADYPGITFNADVEAALENTTWCIYSTHSHTPDNPRLRLLIPLAADITEEQYAPLSRKIAQLIGIDQFDDSTYEAHRLMYWPSTPKDGQYIYQVHDGQPLDPQTILAMYDDWRDATTWPVSSRQITAITTRAKTQADPTTKDGTIGAFCRTYTIEDAIQTFLPNVYAPTVNTDRYTYLPGESTAGLVTYDNKFAYSHHGTDPAGGQLCNAFDLVRIHKFGDQDTNPDTPITRQPSFLAMQDLAVADPAVKAQLAADKAASARADFQPITDWKTDLEYRRGGILKDSLTNLVLIMRNDPQLGGIAFNKHRDGIDIKTGQPLPWDQVKPGWSETDYSQLKNYLQREWNIYSPTKTRDALLVAAAERAYHPIAEWLDLLPAWDGVPRVDHLLADYLGADDNEYTAAVTRKTLVAAVARIYQPGTKFDSVLIISGPQGCGKSTLFARLGGDWFSDSLTLTDMKDKAAAEKLQGYWIVELGELAGMRKMDVETVKGFLSRSDDKYRASYGISVENHPRQCVIVGTTNAESGFLRDVTGNRRFWPVAVTGNALAHPWEITQTEIAQIWAEAKHYYTQGEKLYLTGTAADLAKANQATAMESDEREGLIAQYLDTPIPANWDDMNLAARRSYLMGGEEFTALMPVDNRPRGQLTQRTTTSNVEIWAEAFGKNPADMRPADSYAIAAIMAKIPGWEKTNAVRARGMYGKQRLYQKLVGNNLGTAKKTDGVVP